LRKRFATHWPQYRRSVNSGPGRKEASAEPNEDRKYSHYAHSAVFAEVKIDEQLGVIRVMRVVNAVAAGRILNPKIAGSQILGAAPAGSPATERLGRSQNYSL
jgi:CO/xanthine dehydrogenase Mo-binding subunit